MAKKPLDFSKIFSFSKLDLFDQCPKRYHFMYLDPEIAPRKKEFIKPRDYKTKGQAVHGAITLFYHLPAGKRTFENLKKCLHEAWYADGYPKIAPPLGEFGGFMDIDHERKSYRDSLVLLKNFFALKDIEPTLFLNPSKDIKNSFSDYEDMIKDLGDDIQISGKFDRIDTMPNGRLKIVDYKTGKEKDGHFQLEFYKLLAELNFNIPVDCVSFYYLETKNVKNFNFTGIDSGDIRSKIKQKVEKIKNEPEFKPRKNFFCNHCDFVEICPIFGGKPVKNVISL